MSLFIREIQNELDRLGVKPGAPYPLAAFLNCNWYTSPKTTWQKADPRGELTAVPDFYRHFLGLQWVVVGKIAYLDPVDEEVRHVQMFSASENYDLVLRGQRVLLYTFAYDESFQMFCSFNILEKSANPKVYAVPHDEYERAYVRFDTVLELLQTLHQASHLPIPD